MKFMAYYLGALAISGVALWSLNNYLEIRHEVAERNALREGHAYTFSPGEGE
jgi:hypothetical protein